MADLGQKWSNFRYHDNKGWCSENLNSTIKLAVPDNPLFGANSAAPALVQAQLLLIWVENGRIFVTMATRVGPGKIWIAPLNGPSSKTPFGANSAALSFVQAELWPIWVENGQKFKIQYRKEYLTTQDFI